jgi:hypothetical protein
MACCEGASVVCFVILNILNVAMNILPAAGKALLVGFQGWQGTLC